MDVVYRGIIWIEASVFLYYACSWAVVKKDGIDSLGVKIFQEIFRNYVDKIGVCW